MNGHPQQYAESLTDWADLHGEPAPQRPTGPLTEHCKRHGEHVPLSTGDCARCLNEYIDAAEHRRRTAWRTAEYADRADAHHDSHD